MTMKSIDEILELEAFDYLNRLFSGEEGFFILRGEQWVKVAGGKTADDNNWQDFLSNLPVDFVIPKDVMDSSIKVFQAMPDIGVQNWDGLPLVDVSKSSEENAEEYCRPSVTSVIKFYSPSRNPENTKRLVNAVIESQRPSHTPSSAVKRAM
ncbi:conserved hypothetical protein [Vibrio chagasii]|nr:hypothetical protein AOG25_08975 [Vibrio alginolyticus]CAH7153904.1 conserved hypothetical protein [Vibrio chagasii]CAH7324010.1 conserved hypothetical protein [Vibrio chagasii]